MRLNIKAKPAAVKNKVEKIDDSTFVVSVTEPPIQGRANRMILKVLSDYFKVPINNIRIVSGYTSRQKIIEIIK